MNTSYPNQHFHPHETIGKAGRPVCAYCLHRLGTAVVSASIRRELEDDHVCVEKLTARQPHVSLPYN
jgi:hypothetical protein